MDADARRPWRVGKETSETRMSHNQFSPYRIWSLASMDERVRNSESTPARRHSR
jgi:hypothetical protein